MDSGFSNALFAPLEFRLAREAALLAFPSLSITKSSAQTPSPMRLQNRSDAFSLMELLTVMAIIALLSALAQPVMNAIRGSGDLTRAASDISDLLQQARAYAMAKNTYVYFGIKEIEAGKESLEEGTGSVAVAIVASKNGGRPYETPTALSDDPDATNAILPISRLRKFNNTHLAASLPDAGGMADRQTDHTVDLVNGAEAATSFKWPVGAGGKSFTKVIEFDPQGVARVQTAGTQNVHEIHGWIEIPLQLSHGGAGAAVGEKNVAAIQVDGMTGSVRVYRP